MHRRLRMPTTMLAAALALVGAVSSVDVVRAAEQSVSERPPNGSGPTPFPVDYFVPGRSGETEVRVAAQAEPLPPRGEPIRSPLAEPAFDRQPIGSLGVDIRPPAGDLPPDAAGAAFGTSVPADFAQRGHAETLFFWTAPDLRHRPLYFEQRYVERYGYSFGRWQPIASGAQFFGTVPLLPWKMLKDPPWRPVYKLGQLRPDGLQR